MALPTYANAGTKNKIKHNPVSGIYWVNMLYCHIKKQNCVISLSFTCQWTAQLNFLPTLQPTTGSFLKYRCFLGNQYKFLFNQWLYELHKELYI